MKIEIDNEGSSYHAKLTIDGKTVEVMSQNPKHPTGIIGLEPQHEGTLGELIAHRLRGVIIQILQAEAFAADAEGIVESETFTWNRRLNRGALLAAIEQLKIAR